MANELSSLRTHKRHQSRFEHLAPEIRELAQQLLSTYLARAGGNLPSWYYASLCAAASRVAQHGPPPNPQQRLAYRRWKKQRRREAMLREYGDPARGPAQPGSRHRVVPLDGI
jgi:hypothetical protein